MNIRRTLLSLFELLGIAGPPTADGQVLTYQSSSGSAAWVPPAGNTVGTTAISGGGAGRLLYDSGGTLAETPSITTDGTALAVTDSLASPRFTAAVNPGSGVGFVGAAGGGNLLLFCDTALAAVITHISRSYRVPSDYAFSWDASTANTSGPDTFVVRRSAGIVGIEHALDIWMVGGQVTPALRFVAADGTTIFGSFGSNGAWTPPHLADSAASNDTVYYSTTASKLVYKDSGGTVNSLY